MSVAPNDMRLQAAPCPPSQFALFFFGTAAMQAPVGNGILCVGGSQYRLYPSVPTGGGTAYYNVDLSSPPAPGGPIGTGETWSFQCWYRDPVAGGSGFDFSDGLVVTFCP